MRSFRLRSIEESLLLSLRNFCYAQLEVILLRNKVIAKRKFLQSQKVLSEGPFKWKKQKSFRTYLGGHCSGEKIFRETSKNLHAPDRTH